MSVSRARAPLAFALVAVAAVALGCSTGPSAPAPTGDTSGGPSGSALASVAPSASLDASASGDVPASGGSVGPSAAPEAPTYGVGERIRVGNEEYITVTDVDLDATSDSGVPPAKDTKWVAALVLIDGIDPAGASYNPFFFTLRDGAGVEYNVTLLGKEPQLQSSNSLKPGKKARGWVTFEVPAGATGFALEYAPLLRQPVVISL